jgi:hypothetical protein
MLDQEGRGQHGIVLASQCGVSWKGHLINMTWKGVPGMRYLVVIIDGSIRMLLIHWHTLSAFDTAIQSGSFLGPV